MTFFYEQTTGSFSANSRYGSEQSPRSSRLSDATFKYDRRVFKSIMHVIKKPTLIKFFFMNVANRSPFASRRGPNGRAYDISPPDTDISFVSSRRSGDVFPTSMDFLDGPTPPRLSGFSDVDYQGFDSWNLGRKSVDVLSPIDFSSASPEHDKGFAPQNMVRLL